MSSCGSGARNRSSGSRSRVENSASRSQKPSAAPSPAVADRKFVRSAEMRFRCRSVVQTTTAIERIVADAGGYVARNDLQVRMAEAHEEPHGDDSLIRIERVDIVNDLQLYGRRLAYTLALPKGDAHDWHNVTVEFFGQKFHTYGDVAQGIENLIPLCWNKKVTVERYE